jgi:hypothetical protein
VACREIEVDKIMPRPTERTPRSNGRKGFPAGNVFQELPEEAVDSQRSEAKRQGRSRDPLETYTQTAADELEKIAEGARAAACELEEQDEPTLSSYVLDAADHLFKFADQLRGKSAEQLFHEADRLARDNPALFLAGSVAVGFGLTRFARASGRRSLQSARPAEGGLFRPASGSALDQAGPGLGPSAGQAAPDLTGTTVAATQGGTVSTAKTPGRTTQPLSPGDIGQGSQGMTGTAQAGAHESAGPASQQNDKGPNGGTKR